MLAPLVAALALAAVPRAAIAQPPPPAKTITIQPGDTLSDIAVRFYGSSDAVDRIMAANRLSDPDRILAGATLQLPPSAAAAATVPAATAATAASTSAPATTIASTAGQAARITIQAGETLSAISQRYYGTPAYAAALASLNGLPDPNLVFAGMRLSVPPTPPTTTGTGSSTLPLAGRNICLDPGHGGAEEPGAVYEFDDGRVLREADVTLDISLTLRAWLRADGASVTMTRTTDSYLGLEERAAICNAAGADIAVSVHLNSVSNPAWNGALALFFKMIDRRLSDKLAATLQAGLARSAPGTPFTNFGSQPFDGMVLRRALMPSVIVEPVFLSNPGEALALLVPTGQGDSRRYQIVRETYRGIRLYFSDR